MHATTITYIEPERMRVGAELFHNLKTGERTELASFGSRLLLFGRGGTAHVPIDDPRVSAHQFALRSNGSFWLIYAQKAKNRTYLNGMALEVGESVLGQPVLLGSIIRAGQSAWIGLAPETPSGELSLNVANLEELLLCARLVFNSTDAAAAAIGMDRKTMARRLERMGVKDQIPNYSRPGPRKKRKRPVCPALGVPILSGL